MDDSLDARLLLERILADAGYAPIYLAQGAEEAFALLATTADVDVVLLDAVMPGIDGMEACRRMKAERPDLVVIMVTALACAVDLDAAFAAGANDYIAKPPRRVELLARVRAAVRLKHEMDARAELTRRLAAANLDLERLSGEDALTGLANRRHFDAILVAEWRRGARSAGELAAVMVDIDFFKAFNDCLGHPRGDQALRDVAAVLRSAVSRPADLVARYGGEEFVLLLPETAVDGAEYIAERLRVDVAALGIPHPRSRAAPHLSISLGVAGARPELDAAPGSLIAAADQALYWAKRSGRNCVRRFGGDVPILGKGSERHHAQGGGRRRRS